jgi:hypothetical protein
MTITSPEELFNALANNASRIVVDKASIANQLANTLCSMWRATGQPAQGAIPGTTFTVPTKATLGAMDFTNQTAPATSYLPWFLLYSGNSGGGFEVHDRVGHMGGLSLTVNTLQTIVGADLSTAGVPAARLGAPDYSDVQWFLETYADGGATASNATINVTYDDATTGNLNAIAVGGTLRASRMLPLTPLIPTAQQGKKIRGINSIILSAATGVAGNFGFTCTRQRTGKAFAQAGTPTTLTWVDGCAESPNDSCNFFVINCSTTSSGTLRGQGKIAHG